MPIKPIPLTPEAFAPFGQVLQGSGARSERQPFAARMVNGRADARPNLTYMKIEPEVGPIRIGVLERHVHSNQTFVPLNGTRQLVVVCPSAPDGRPLIEGLQAFVVEGSQAINYDANVWHAPRMALSGPGEFVMFRWDDGSPLDTELVELEPAIEIVIEAPSP
jgi:ureidoglycolate lyase